MTCWTCCMKLLVALQACTVIVCHIAPPTGCKMSCNKLHFRMPSQWNKQKVGIKQSEFSCARNIITSSPHQMKMTGERPHVSLSKPPFSCPFNSRTHLLTHAHPIAHKRLHYREAWLSLHNLCMKTANILGGGSGNHPAATSSEKQSNLKALRTKCDIHDLDSRGSRAKPPCHNLADVIPIQTKRRGSEVRSGERVPDLK